MAPHPPAHAPLPGRPLGRLPWLAYGVVLLFDIAVLVALASLFWLLVDVAEDWLW